MANNEENAPVVQAFIENSNRVYANVVTLTAQQPRQQLPALHIPNDRAITIMSNPSNPPLSIVLIDGQQVSATSYPLVPGQDYSYKVKDASSIFVGSIGPFPPGGLIVNYTVEQD